MFLIPAACAATQTPSDNGSVLQKHYDLAQSAQEFGNLTAAASQYRVFIADALAEFAIEAINSGEYRKAVPRFDEALRLAPRSPALSLRYAQAAFASDDSMRARTLLEGVLQDYPENAKALARGHLLLGRVLLKMNQAAVARTHFEAAVALDPTFENGYSLAIACLDAGDEQGAVKIFGEMLAGLGDTAALHVEIGLAYLNSDFQPKAIPELQEAVAKDPKLAGVHYALAIALLTLGGEERLASARQELEAETANSPNDAATHAQLGYISFRQGHLADAEQELKRSISLKSTDPNAFFYFGQVLSATNRNTEAIGAFRQSIALTTDPAANRFQVQKAHYLLGRLLLQSGQEDAAKREMQTSSALLKESLNRDRHRLAEESGAGSDGPFKKMTGYVTERSDRAVPETLASLRAFEKRLAPALADSYNNLGVIAAETGDLDQALISFEHAFEWKPDLDGLDSNWGLAAFEGKHYVTAIPPLARFLLGHPNDSKVRSELATSLFETGRFSDVVGLLSTAKAQTDQDVELNYIYAASLLKTGQTDSGLTRLLALEKDNDARADIHRALGEGDAIRGDFAHALSELGTAIKLEPTNGDAHSLMGQVAMTQGNLVEAIRELETAVKLDPKAAKEHELLAAAYRKKHRGQDADREQAMAQALALKSPGPSLAQTLCIAGKGECPHP